jgi:hypothetical protein
VVIVDATSGLSRLRSIVRQDRAVLAVDLASAKQARGAQRSRLGRARATNVHRRSMVIDETLDVF